MSLAHTAWTWLERELDAWAEADLKADFWWRDDDATQDSAALERLLTISERGRVPVALAVIPAQVQSSLAQRLQDCKRVSVLQHGYDHHSHAAPGQRKLELGGLADRVGTLDNLRTGMNILKQKFGPRFHPVLVPPWNRIDSDLLKSLTPLGLRGLSAMRVRRAAYPADGLLQVNTHLDPINWRHNSGFIGIYPAIAILIQHLQARRTGYREFEEPTGILSHHLVQNEAVWTFLEELLAALDAHPAARWRDAASIWQA